MSALFDLMPSWDCASFGAHSRESSAILWFKIKRDSIITEIAKLLYLLQRLPMHRSERTLCQNVRKLITRPHVIDQIGMILVHSFKHPIQTNSESTLCVGVSVCLCHMPQIAPMGGITADLLLKLWSWVE